MKGRIVSYIPTGANAGQITVDVDSDFRCQFDGLQDKDIDIEIKRWRDHRSLDANAYCWVLITEIANVLLADKQDIYIDLLKHYGQGGLVYVPDDYKMVLREFKYHEIDETTDGGAYYHVWVGSSQYNTREMAILIDGIISEAKELEIPTETPDEIARMKELWGK